MWWDMAPGMRSEFEHWHSHEHFPERLAVPGFLRASRWTSATGGEGIFVMYELASHEILSSAAYVSHLNSPTPWSTRMMPHHRNMVRSQSHVLASRGFAIARNALTVRFSAVPSRCDELHQRLTSLIEELVKAPGFAGAHLLQHQTPAMAQTTEQKIRGAADRAADLVLVVCAYESEVLASLDSSKLSFESLLRYGAAPEQQHGLYVLSCSAARSECC